MTASRRLGEVEEALARRGSPGRPGGLRRREGIAAGAGAAGRLVEEFTQLGGPGYQGMVKATLRSLGLRIATSICPSLALSGGQRKLVGLAKLMVVQPSLLLLDEPDNHLDLAGKALLEDMICGYKGAVVIVSHDRYLLDVVADEIVELEDGQLTRYPGNYRSMLSRSRPGWNASSSSTTSSSARWIACSRLRNAC
ncbi:MAG: ATP-binding cassette domain-containing protein [Caldilineales bacterium]